MHPNPIFRQADAARNIDFARAQALGALAVNADPAPLLSHVPFLLSPDGRRAEAHLVRSNPIARLLREGPRPCVIAVTGPHGYISPDWYGLEDQVPTWNYVAVHLRGRVQLLPDTSLRAVLDRLSAEMETRLAPKAPWTLDKMTAEARDKLMRQIVPIEMEVSEIDGTWKLGQNKPESARTGAADGLAEADSGLGAQALAAWMRDPPA